MRFIRSTTVPLVLAAVLGLGACSPDREPEPAVDAAPVVVHGQPEAAPVALAPGLIERLKQRYPVLREERAPEPQPGAEANPGVVPERFRERLSESVLASVTGGATFYADRFEGRRTASGMPFRQHQMVAAHRGYPFGTLLRVTNLSNDRSVNVRVVDRGPFGSAAKRHGTIIDLSRRAAERLGYTAAGRAQVKLEVLEWGEGLPRSS